MAEVPEKIREGQGGILATVAGGDPKRRIALCAAGPFCITSKHEPAMPGVRITFKPLDPKQEKVIEHVTVFVSEGIARALAEDLSLLAAKPGTDEREHPDWPGMHRIRLTHLKDTDE